MASIGETRYRCVSEDEFRHGVPATAPGQPARAQEWVLQQIIKLEGYRFVTTDHYLIVDADVVFLNETPLFDAEGRVTVAIDPPRAAIAASRARQHARGQRGDARDGVGPAPHASREVHRLRALSQPFAAQPEGRALVAEQRAQASGPRPPSAAVAAYHDRAGAGEDQDAGNVSERSQQRGLGVGEHLDTRGKRGQAGGQRASLAHGPDPAGGDDQRTDVAA
jgi:hypothetical protein